MDEVDLFSGVLLEVVEPIVEKRTIFVLADFSAVKTAALVARAGRVHVQQEIRLLYDIETKKKGGCFQEHTLPHTQ